MPASTFSKRYSTTTARLQAEHNHAWLSATAPSLNLPKIIRSSPTLIEFEWLDGRYAEPPDLERLAGHLGTAHGVAWQECLHRARMATPFASGDHVVPDFVHLREAALRQRHRDGHIASAQDLHEAVGHLRESSARPVAFYKDSNLRNVLITPCDRLVMVDVDDVSLAPFGYDLAKLVVSLAMAYGRLPADRLRRALAVYNEGAATEHAGLGDTSPAQFQQYADTHGVLTAPYVGHGGYRWPWADVRTSMQFTVRRQR